MRIEEMSIKQLFDFYRDTMIDGKKDMKVVHYAVKDIRLMLEAFEKAVDREIRNMEEKQADARVNIVADRDNWRKQALSEAARYDFLMEAVRRLLKAEDEERKLREESYKNFAERKAAENAIVDLALAATKSRAEGGDK